MAWLSVTALGCNRRCFVATDCAVMEQATLRSNRPCSAAVAAARQSVCVVRVGADGPSRKETLVGNGLSGSERAEVGMRVRVALMRGCCDKSTVVAINAAMHGE